MARYYTLADVFVSVSSLDSSPASLLEAMASGTTPVVGELPPILEWVIDGWNGHVVPLGDPRALAQAIIRAITHPEERRVFAQRNLELIREKGDHDKEMGKMEELYRLLIKQKR
jgi:glycosyltransferase involved in cell wall biosynthesis